MTGKQQAVLWLGLALITLRFFTTGQFKQVWSVVAGTATPATPSTAMQIAMGLTPPPATPPQPTTALNV